MLRAHFMGANLALASTTHGHRGQEVVYTFRERMTLKAVKAIKMTSNERAARIANRTYHVHPHTGDTWHYALPVHNGMEGISPLLECILQGNDISALAKVAGEWVAEAGGIGTCREGGGEWAVGAIWRATYRRGK